MNDKSGKNLVLTITLQAFLILIEVLISWGSHCGCGNG